MRRSISYLPGEYSFYENLSGREVLAFLANVGGRLRPGRVEGLARRLGAELDRPIRTLSHGNKQKLAIVLAFQGDAPLLILDEPTTGLDPLVQQEFFGLVDEVRRDGRTVLLSSHNLPEVERVCDRVGMIREGRLVAVEPVADIGGQAMRLVTVEYAREPAADIADGLAGVEQARVDGRTLRCRVRGPVGPLLERTAPLGIVDVACREPSLEEFFLARYGTTEAGHAR